MHVCTHTQNLPTKQTNLDVTIRDQVPPRFGMSSFMEWCPSKEKPKGPQILTMEKRWNVVGILLMPETCETVKIENLISHFASGRECKKIYCFACLCCHLSHAFLIVKKLGKTEGKEEPQGGGMAVARKLICWGSITIKKHFLSAKKHFHLT